MTEEIGFDFNTEALLGPLNQIVQLLEKTDGKMQNFGKDMTKSVLKANIATELIVGAFNKIKNSIMSLPEISATYEVVSGVLTRNLLEPLRKELLPMLQRIMDWAVESRGTLVMIGTLIADAFRTGIEVVMSLIKIAKSVINGFMRGVKTIFGDTAMTIGDVARLIMTKIAATAIFVATMLEPVGETIGMVLGTVISWLLKTDETLGALLGGGAALLVAYIWRSIIPAIGALTKSFIAFSTALLTNPLTWFVISVAALTAGIIWLVKNFDKVKKWLIDMDAALFKFEVNVIKYMLTPFINVGKAFSDVIANIVSLYHDTVTKLQIFGQLIYDKIIDPIISGFNNIYDKVFSKIKSVMDFFKKDKSIKIDHDININPKNKPPENQSTIITRNANTINTPKNKQYNQNINVEHKPQYNISANGLTQEQLVKMTEEKEEKNEISFWESFKNKVRGEKLAEGN